MLRYLGWMLFTVLCFGTLEAKSAEYHLLITGCARSGTSYMAQVLQKCGLDIPHERLGVHGTVNWIMAVPADYTPAAYDFTHCCVPGLNNYKFKHIFHQVRDPLKSISSLAVDMTSTWEFIGSFIQEVDVSHPTIVNAARYWYYWNLHAEKIAEWTYQIENIDKVWKEFCHRIEFKLDKNNLKRVPQNTNTGRVQRRITWAELKRILEPDLYENIVNMARRYGYSVKDKG